MNELLKLIISSHGGLENWNKVKSFKLDIEIRGNILLSHFKSPFWRKLKIVIYTKKICTVIEPFPSNGFIGIFEKDVVRIERKDNSLIHKERENPREHAIRSRVWDDLDLLYFFGYALWNYMLTPFLFLEPGFVICELEPIIEKNKILHRLQVQFPDNIPTHCPIQIFYFNESGFLERLDYTAEVFGKFANGAHMCKDYKNFYGYHFPTYRRVVPHYFGKKISFFQVMEGKILTLELDYFDS